MIVVIGCLRMNDPGEKNDEQATVENTDALKMQKERSRQLALAAIQTAEDNGGRDLLVLDMREHTSLFDYFVIATGTSRRQLPRGVRLVTRDDVCYQRRPRVKLTRFLGPI